MADVVNKENNTAVATGLGTKENDTAIETTTEAAGTFEEIKLFSSFTVMELVLLVSAGCEKIFLSGIFVRRSFINYINHLIVIIYSLIV